MQIYKRNIEFHSYNHNVEGFIDMVCENAMDCSLGSRMGNVVMVYCVWKCGEGRGLTLHGKRKFGK